MNSFLRSCAALSVMLMACGEPQPSTVTVDVHYPDAAAPEFFFEPCHGVTTHDFDTTDPETLARVSVFIEIAAANSFEVGNYTVTDETPQEFYFAGSVAVVSCTDGDTAVFVLR